jgi:vacuolar-type H+-ATPase subunit F/Vma7
MEKHNIGIVLTDKKIFEMLNDRLKEKTMTQVKPTVVVLSHDLGGEENLRHMIKRSLGIDLWNKGD